MRQVLVLVVRLRNTQYQTRNFQHPGKLDLEGSIPSVTTDQLPQHCCGVARKRHPTIPCASAWEGHSLGENRLWKTDSGRLNTMFLSAGPIQSGWPDPGALGRVPCPRDGVPTRSTGRVSRFLLWASREGTIPPTKGHPSNRRANHGSMESIPPEEAPPSRPDPRPVRKHHPINNRGPQPVRILLGIRAS